MDEFTRTKIGFTITLLAALFTLQPLVDAYESVGFVFLSYNVTIRLAFLIVLGALGLAVYLISFQFIAGRRIDWLDRSSDVVYGIALLVPLAFIALWGLVILIGYLETFTAAIPTNLLNVLAGIAVGAATSAAVGKLISTLKSYRLALESNESRRKEIEALGRVQTLFSQGHYDLAAIELARIIELALKPAISNRTGETGLFSLSNLIRRARELKLLSEYDAAQVDELRELRNNSIHLDAKVSKEAAERALKLAEKLLKSLDFQVSVPSFRWLMAHRSEALRALREKNKNLVPLVLEHLRNAWRDRDGAIWLEISDFFEEGLIHLPGEALLALFDHDFSAFDEWLREIDTQIFTDFKGGDTARLQTVKERMIESLRGHLATKPNEPTKTMAKVLLEKLPSVRIREIQ